MRYWDQLTNVARRAVLVAQDEAAGLGAAEIAPGHLLMGLLQLGEGGADEALRALGVDPSCLIADCRRDVARGEEPTPRLRGFAADSEAVFRAAAEEAESAGRPAIGSVHLLIGLAHEQAGEVGRRLTSIGVSAEAVRQLVPNLTEAMEEEPHVAAVASESEEIHAAVMDLVRARRAVERAKTSLRELGVSLKEQTEQSARAAQVVPLAWPRVLVAPDSFKGSLTANEACEAIGQGVERALPEAQITKIPLADGGEGTAQALVDATGGRMVSLEVTGPMGEPVEAGYGLLGDGETAAIEMAAASGLTLVPHDRRDPVVATTYGTGELISDALSRGCKRLIIGLGGSATVDGGAGMAQALGVKLISMDGHELGYGGAELARLARVEMGELRTRLAGVTVLAACDVKNPLCGPTGAALVYGPQKGATPEAAERLDAALANFAQVVRRDLRADVADLPGAGAAGGLGAGLAAFLGAELRPGIEIVLEAVGFEQVAAQADLVITGEGRLDMQSAFGKTISGVGSVAKRHGVPVIAFAGSLDGSALLLGCEGVDAMLPIIPEPMSLQEAMLPDNAARMLAQATEQSLRAAVLLR
ncbi:MAG: glycerate kinase [Armatimonadota bacterium]